MLSLLHDPPAGAVGRVLMREEDGKSSMQFDLKGMLGVFNPGFWVQEPHLPCPPSVQLDLQLKTFLSS